MQHRAPNRKGKIVGRGWQTPTQGGLQALKNSRETNREGKGGGREEIRKKRKKKEEGRVSLLSKGKEEKRTSLLLSEKKEKQTGHVQPPSKVRKNLASLLKKEKGGKKSQQ